MGIYDREYYRDSLPRGGFGYFNAWSVATWLIVLNIAIFFVDAGLFRASHAPGRDFDDDDDAAVVDPRLNHQTREEMMLAGMGPIQRWGYLSVEKGIYRGQVWRFLTFQFLHASPIHLIFNMVGIYLFSPIVESLFGGRRFLIFYLLCGLAGAGSYLLLSFTHVLIIDPTTPMVGASAGIFGLLVAAALIAPDMQVFYYMFPVTIGMLAIVGMLAALYSVISMGYNAGGEAAHLGGGILGFVIIKNQHWLNVFIPAKRMVAGQTMMRGRRVRRALQKDWSKDMNR